MSTPGALPPDRTSSSSTTWASTGLNQQQSEDLYALVIESHRRSSFIVTSNREVSEWVALFADPILANSALDRLASGAHQLVIEGTSCGSRQAPKGRGEEVRM